MRDRRGGIVQGSRFKVQGSRFEVPRLNKLRGGSFEGTTNGIDGSLQDTKKASSMTWPCV
jgi:hypothetical protein